jgi:large subunit ribosomal protein L6
MSRVGRLPVVVDKSVKAAFAERMLKVEGPRGKLELRLPPGFSLEMEDSKIVVKRPSESKRDRAMHGLYRKLIANMVTGVCKGFTRVLEINGVGYRAELKGKEAIQLSLGYSHPIVYQFPPGVSAKIDRQTIITLEGADKQMLGEVAAQIRALRPPEPYKAKGIKYAEEVIKRKAGKAAAGATAT